MSLSRRYACICPYVLSCTYPHVPHVCMCRMPACVSHLRANDRSRYSSKPWPARWIPYVYSTYRLEPLGRWLRMKVCARMLKIYLDGTKFGVSLERRVRRDWLITAYCGTGFDSSGLTAAKIVTKHKRFVSISLSPSLRNIRNLECWYCIFRGSDFFRNSADAEYRWQDMWRDVQLVAALIAYK